MPSIAEMILAFLVSAAALCAIAVAVHDAARAFARYRAARRALRVDWARFEREFAAYASTAPPRPQRRSRPASPPPQD